MQNFFYYLYKPLFIFSTLLYLVNRFCLKVFFNQTSFITNYFNDLLLTPVLLPIILTVGIIFKQRYWVFKPSLAEILFWVIIFSIFFEVITPCFNPRSTGDYMDAICYLSGGLVYWKFGGQPAG